MSVFVIAEAGSCHSNSIESAYALIQHAKTCGADAVKFQYWSDSWALAERRKLGPDAEKAYAKVKLPMAWLPLLKAKCDDVGIEFMCTTYLIQDIAVVAPFVKRFKVSAFESCDRDFMDAHPDNKPLIASQNFAVPVLYGKLHDVKKLYCVSMYPTPLEKLDLSTVAELEYDGFSDHSGHVLTGAAAVACGAKIIEAHIRLWDTPVDNPDYPHSLVCDTDAPFGFQQYVRNIRTVERML